MATSPMHDQLYRVIVCRKRRNSSYKWRNISFRTGCQNRWNEGKIWQWRIPLW